MKKLIAWIFTLVLAFTTTAGCAEQTDQFFARLDGIEWSFSSGVGGWSTDLRILPDGTFSGEYHDSEMGETGEDFPEGTVYLCSFSGKMSLLEQADENTWKIRVDTLTEEGEEGEAIEDGIRFVYTVPYGLSEGDEMLLYQPGTPVKEFTEEMMMWAHLLEQEETPTELKTWFLSSEQNGSGFVGFPVETGVSLANPWEELTEEQMQAMTGRTFVIPDGAENVVWRWLGSEKMAELDYYWEGDDFCFRAQPAKLKAGELMEISGMYFKWEYEEAIQVGECPGIIGMAQTGSEDWVQRCLWYDEKAGMMYSLGVATTDPDGLDLVAVAEQICYPDAE